MVHGDRLDDRAPAVSQPVMDDLHVLVPVLRAHGLDHLDGDDRVIGAGGLAVVAQLHIHQVGQPLGRDTLARQVRLLGRQRHRGDLRTAPCGMQRQLAPAGTDLEDATARTHPGAVQGPLDLGVLRGGEIVLRVPVEEGRGIAEALVEEGREEVVGEVVVGADVALRPGHRVLLPERTPRGVQPTELLQPGGKQRGDLPAQFRQRPRQVGGVPVPGDIGLPETDESLDAEPPVEVLGAVEDEVGVLLLPHRDPAHRRSPVTDLFRDLPCQSGIGTGRGGRVESVLVGGGRLAHGAVLRNWWSEPELVPLRA